MDDDRSEYEGDDVAGATPESESDGDANVRIFLRVKPSKRPSGFFAWDEDTSLMQYNIPKDVAAGLINNSRTSYKFRFDAVIGMEAKQDEVFDRVGRPCVQNALNGFNSTVFAYGQTGSGKTFTITGGAERYEDRGLIPRALSMIFDDVKANPSKQLLVHISYLEIYNNQGYDLLDPQHEASKTKTLEDLPRVSMLEDEDGNCHLRNLSMHLVHSEEDALNLLFLGDTNRAVSETPMNLASSRSHCIFTVSLETRRVGSEVVLRSKLHLVDLAGSERAHKTGAKGQLLREATYINTSLHYLEMVIVALHEKHTKGRTHIPYRNSMLTSVLRDSLGGNCKTVMVATVSPEREQTDESVSTCRFAQRVARVRNDARLNEEVDPQVIIRQLKAQVAQLTEELAIARGDVKEGDALKDYELDKLRQRVTAFVSDADPSAHLSMGEFTYTKMKACFSLLKELAREPRGAATTGSNGATTGSGLVAISGNNQEQEHRIAELEQLVMQRDNEIAILVKLIRKQRAGTGATDVEIPEELLTRPLPEGSSSSNNNNNHNNSNSSGSDRKSKAGSSSKGAPTDTSFPATFQVDAAVLEDPAKAFEAFRAQYPQSSAMRENKALLKRKYEAAKALATVVNDARQQIKTLTAQMDKARKQQAIADEGLLATDASAEDAALENKLKDQIEQHKTVYKKGFHDLSELKKEIQHIQKLLEMGRLKLQKDFDLWYQRQGKSALLTEALLAADAKANNQRDDADVKAADRPAKSVSPVRADKRPPTKPATPRSSLSSSGSRSESPRDVRPQKSSSQSSVEDDVSGFYEALDILKRRNSRK
ncbi:hypothetical protein ATCC90586_006163 [Pythium insidiosum]|nr:hypothetical protein ATCC90586_006163 [Pythium insidiosum]